MTTLVPWYTKTLSFNTNNKFSSITLKYYDQSRTILLNVAGNGYRVAKKKENSKTNTNASKSLYFIIKWWRSVQDAFSQSKYCKPFATACIVSFRVFGRQGLMTMQTILDLFPTVSFLLERRFYLSRGEFSRAKGLNWMIN